MSHLQASTKTIGKPQKLWFHYYDLQTLLYRAYTTLEPSTSTDEHEPIRAPSKWYLCESILANSPAGISITHQKSRSSK